jgi:hypothetical protein
MANIYGHLQWILDTAGVISTDKIRVKKLEWVPNAQNDDLVINDSNGESVWTVTNATAAGRSGLETLDFGEKGQDFLGFDLDTIGGGILYVWVV